MSSAALALVVLAAVLHASWNFVSKKSAAGSEFVLLYEIFALLIYFPLLFFADFNKLTRLPIEGWLLIVLSALLHVIYTGCAGRPAIERRITPWCIRPREERDPR